MFVEDKKPLGKFYVNSRFRYNMDGLGAVKKKAPTVAAVKPAETSLFDKAVSTAVTAADVYSKVTQKQVTPEPVKVVEVQQSSNIASWLFPVAGLSALAYFMLFKKKAVFA